MTKRKSPSRTKPVEKGEAEVPYNVGFGRPPQHSQFKPGQSGNPKGRPLGAKGFEATLKRELDREIMVIEGGRSRKMSRSQVIIKRVLEQAIKGDMRATKFVADYDTRIASRIEAEIEARSQLEGGIEPDRDAKEILSFFADRARGGDWTPDDGGSE